MTGIKKYCVIYENTDNFAKIKLLKMPFKGYKRLIGGPANTEKYVLTLPVLHKMINTLNLETIEGQFLFHGIISVWYVY